MTAELNIDDIPPLRGPRPEGAERVRRRVPSGGGWSELRRRSLLSGVLAAGGTAGLAALGAFPQARNALSDGYRLVASYDIYPRCPAYAADHNCSPGCGPSVVCADCCATSGPHKGFHKGLRASNNTYKLRPNQCYAGHYSGWTWAYAHPCGSCKKSVTWRCHDGWRRNSNGSYHKSVCRWALSCKS